MKIFELRKENLLLSTNKELLDLDLIHSFLSQSYWSPGIPKKTVIRAVDNALAVGLYKAGQQIGYCRLITDYTTFAYLADVFIVEKERGKGYAYWMIENLQIIPELKGLERWVLATRDAHSLYEKLGWKRLAYSEYFMEIVNKKDYSK